MFPERQTLLDWIKPEPPSPDELEYMKLLKPGDYEIYSDRLDSILLEAREVFIRTGLSSMLRSGDLIVGIYTPAGDMVCASCGTSLHAALSPLPIKFTIKNWLPDPTVGVREGDIFYCNEALYGGMHNPDQIAFMPVFHNGELIAWTADNVYHVAYDPETLEVDHEKTEELRRRERERRKEQGQRYEEFEREWSQKRPPEAALKHYGSWPDAKKVREIIRG